MLTSLTDLLIDDDNEIHDVPKMSEVAALGQDEPVGHLHREDGNENGHRFF